MYILARFPIIPSPTFSSAWTRFLALCTVAIAAAGATCLLAATYYFLEKVSLFVFAFSGVFTLLSWLLFLVYVPYGLVRLPWTFLSLPLSPSLPTSAFIARVRKRSDAQYTQRVQQAEAFREELKRSLPAELQVAEKLGRAAYPSHRAEMAFTDRAGLWAGAAQVGAARKGEPADPQSVAGTAARRVVPVLWCES